MGGGTMRAHKKFCLASGKRRCMKAQKKFGFPSGKPNSLLYVDGAKPVSHILNGLIRERNVREDPLLDPS